MEINIGDIFVINSRGSRGTYNRWYKCKDPNKSFVVKSFTKSELSVYYDDLRTNIKCKCSNCSGNKKERCIGVSDITIIETRLERLREIKLKLLIGK